MKHLFRLILLVALAALGIWLWRVAFPDPRKAISHRLQELARLASFAPNETSFHRFTKVERLGRLFSEDVQVNVDVPGEQHVFNGRNELMQVAMASKQLGNGMNVEFVDPQIELGSGKQEALVDLTLKARISGDNDLMVEELNLTMKKINGDWLITRVDTVRVLKP